MYSTVKDVRSALTPGGAGTDASTAASLDDALIIEQINEADSIVDQHVTQYLPIPTEEVSVGTPEAPAVQAVAKSPVRYWSRNIAAWLATLTFKRNKDVTADDPVRLRYNMTMAQLIAVRDGKATLPFPVGGGTGDGEPLVINQYVGTLFHPEDLGLAYQQVSSARHIWPGGG